MHLPTFVAFSISRREAEIIYIMRKTGVKTAVRIAGFHGTITTRTVYKFLHKMIEKQYITKTGNLHRTEYHLTLLGHAAYLAAKDFSDEFNETKRTTRSTQSSRTTRAGLRPERPSEPNGPEEEPHHIRSHR